MALTIKLVRHGESEANIGKMSSIEVGDFSIPLSERGRAQASEAGTRIGAEFLHHAIVYTSPYRRARETLDAILGAVGLSDGADGPVRAYEDPRLREVEHGYEALEPQEALRKKHGWFYYRFSGGESPADCYDRTSSFLESLMRQAERRQSDRVLIVTHGLTIRCFVMRFLHLSVAQFDQLANPSNCEIITIAHAETLEAPLVVSGKWGVAGLRFREDDE